MSSETLNLGELAQYLQRDARELEKLVSRGRLPGRRVAGDWRFNRDEINQWLETELASLSQQQLEDVEFGVRGDFSHSKELGPLLSRLITVERMAVPLEARTAPSVIEQLVATANSTWQVYEPEKVVVAVKDREQLCTTALPGGVAVPHPRRTVAESLGESLVAYGRTTTGIAFGGPGGALTDLFFLILCRDERLHLQVLTRLSRMLLQAPDFLSRLRATETAPASFDLICEVEAATLG